jgi:hypothetical protein
MNGPRVLLMTLSERTSAKGLAYLSGWLGKAKLVGFRSKENDKYGNPVWEIYVSPPQEKLWSSARTEAEVDRPPP